MVYIYVVKRKHSLKIVDLPQIEKQRRDVVEWKKLHNSLNWRVDSRKQQVNLNSETNLH